MLNKLAVSTCLFTLLIACNKPDSDFLSRQPSCDLIKTYKDNASKVSISNGIWGTVSFMEGNCMPAAGGTYTCKECPVKRVVRIYTYTTIGQAIPQVNTGGFYDSFSTQLIKEVTTDNNGFFQINLAAGHYSIVVVENGKLYGSGLDGQGGISPFVFTNGLQNGNFRIIYKAAF